MSSNSQQLACHLGALYLGAAYTSPPKLTQQNPKEKTRSEEESSTESSNLVMKGGKRGGKRLSEHLTGKGKERRLRAKFGMESAVKTNRGKRGLHSNAAFQPTERKKKGAILEGSSNFAKKNRNLEGMGIHSDRGKSTSNRKNSECSFYPESTKRWETIGGRVLAKPDVQSWALRRGGGKRKGYNTSIH